MTTKRALGYLLAFVPASERDSALRGAQADLEADGDHVGVQACAALLQERRAAIAQQVRGPAPASTTWDGEERRDRDDTAERVDEAIRKSWPMALDNADAYLRGFAQALRAGGDDFHARRCIAEIYRRKAQAEGHSGGPL